MVLQGLICPFGCLIDAVIAAAEDPASKKRRATSTMAGQGDEDTSASGRLLSWLYASCTAASMLVIVQLVAWPFLDMSAPFACKLY